MEICWICLQNTYNKRKGSIPSGIEPVFASHNGKGLYPVVIEAKELSYEVLSLAEDMKATIFIEGAEIDEIPLPQVREIASRGIRFFWNLNDLMLYFNFLNRLNNGCPIDRLIFEIDKNGHSIRTSELTAMIAALMGFDKESLNLIKVSAAYHDIGKITIPQSLLHSKKWFNDAEREFVKSHTHHGANIISKINLDADVKYLAENLAYSHHERLDGSGYPEGKRADEINLSTRIIMVADVYEALRSNRSYRSQCDRDLAMSYLKAKKGQVFDREVVQVLEALVKNNKNNELQWL